MAITDAQWNSLRPYPADGTFVSDVQNGMVYEVVGGAPLYVSGTDASYLPGWTSALRVPHWDFTAYQHLRQHPIDGTLLIGVPSQKQFDVVGGIAQSASGATAVTSVDDSAIVNQLHRSV